MKAQPKFPMKFGWSVGHPRDPLRKAFASQRTGDHASPLSGPSPQYSGLPKRSSMWPMP